MTQVVRLFEGADMDREKALEAAISQIERGFGKGSIAGRMVERLRIALS